MNVAQRLKQAGSRKETTNLPALLAYVCLGLLFFAPHLLGLTAFPDGDFTRHYLPYSFFQQNSLFAGTLPVWNVHVNAGHPFLADTESAALYPLSNLLLVLTGFARTIVGRLYWLQVEALVHLVMACSFTGLLVTRLTGRRMAGFAAGLLFGFSGYLTGYPLLQIGILRVAVWLPLILWLLLPDKTEPPNWRRWLLAAAVHAVAFFANHPQTFLFLTYAVGGWMLTLFVCELSRSRQPRREPPFPRPLFKAYVVHGLSFAPRVAAYAAALIMLTAAQLWPAMEFTGLSLRSARPYHEMSHGFPLEHAWQLLLPGVLSHYSPIYVGIASLGLSAACVGALFSNRFRFDTFSHPLARPAAVYFLICGGAALLVSFGDNLPFYPLLYRFAPGWSLFRSQERVAYLVTFSLSITAGFGFALLPLLTARWRKIMCWSFLAAVAAGLLLFAVGWSDWSQAENSPGHLVVKGGITLIIALLFVRLCAGRSLSATHLLLLLPLLLADLFASGYLTNLASGPEIRAALRRPDLIATSQAANELAQQTDGPAPRVFNEFRLPEDSGMVGGWEDVWAASVLRLWPYNYFFVDFPFARMLQLTGVGTVLTWRENLTAREDLPVPGQLMAEFPLNGEASRLYRLESIAPRLWWTQRARRLEEGGAASLLADPEFDMRAELLVAPPGWEDLGMESHNERLSLGENGRATLRAKRRGPAHLEIEVESDQPGLLFVSENWMPGWKATWRESGSSAGDTTLPVVRAHIAFLGIPLPAGAGTLELAYRPASVRWGLTISAIAWLTLLLLFQSSLRRGLALIGRRVSEMLNLKSE